MFQYPAQVLRIIDGDTLWLDIDLGFRTHVQTDIRLAHVNTPEVVKFDSKGIVDAAAAYVAQCVPPGSCCVVDIIKQEKFGRWLGVVYFLPGEMDRVKILQHARVLHTELIEKGFAVAYEGGRK